MKLLAVLLLAGLSVHAQVIASAMQGVVVDASGAAIVGARVEAKNVDNGNTTSVVSDSQGRYIMPTLTPGNYDGQVSKEGFQTSVRKGIGLSVGAQVVVDFQLVVGQSQQSVTVDAQVTQVDTTSAAVANLVESTQMRELPLNGRNFQQLILLAPGVNVAQQSTNSFYGKGDTYSISGGRPEGQAFLLDGTDIANFFTHGTGASSLGTSLGIDAIAEFQTLTNTYGAQFGGNGSVINAVSKGGTNQLHGSLFYFLRNNAFDARNFFDRAAAPPPYRQNQFGGTLGGPIKKDKLFFFLNAEHLKRDQSFSNIAFVPDANGRKGIINGQQLAISPVTAPYLTLYPATNVVNANGSGVTSISQVSTQNGKETYLLTRGDYTYSEKTSFAVRYVRDGAQLRNPTPLSPIPNWPTSEPTVNHYAVIENRHVFTPTLVNVLRSHFVRTVNEAQTLQSNPLLQFTPGLGRQDGVLTVTGLSNVGGQTLVPYNITQNKFTQSNETFWTHGAHSIRFGGSLTRIQTAEFQPFQASGTFRFNSLTDLLTNKPFQFNGAPPESGLNAQRAWREIQFAPYVNDDWKVSQRLTLNLGIRYDWGSNPKTAMDNLFVIENPPLSGVAPYSTAFTKVQNVWKNNPNTKNWGPRFGFAYDPFANHKTAIRGGFGIFQSEIQARTWSSGFVTGPPFFTVQTNTPVFPFPFTATNFTRPLPNQGPSPSYLLNRSPYLMEWNLNIQREVAANTTLTIGYAGSRGVHLMQRHDVNPQVASVDANGIYHFGANGVANPRISPNFSTLNNLTSDGNSVYNSLQMNISRRFSRNFQGQAIYTWSKCLDYGSGSSGLEGSGGAPQSNPYNRRADRGPCSFDVTQGFRANGVYIVPLHGNRLVEGWQLSGILSRTGGLPFNINPGFDRALQQNGSSFDLQRPNLKPGYTASSIILGDPLNYFDKSAFALQESGTVGNLGRNRLRGPGLVSLDMSLNKQIKLTERVGLQFRWEVFNVLNHTNFANLVQASGNVGVFTSTGAFSPSAGVLTSTSTSARQMQFALKLSF